MLDYIEGTLSTKIEVNRRNVTIGSPKMADVVNDGVANTRDSAHHYQYYHQYDLDVVDFRLYLAYLMMHLPILSNIYPWFFNILESYPQ